MEETTAPSTIPLSIKYSGGRWDAWDARKGMASDAAKQQFVKVQCLLYCPFSMSLSPAAYEATSCQC